MDAVCVSWRWVCEGGTSSGPVSVLQPWGERGALHGKSPALWVDGHSVVNLHLFSCIDQTRSFGLKQLSQLSSAKSFLSQGWGSCSAGRTSGWFKGFSKPGRLLLSERTRVLPLCSLNPLSSSTTKDTGGPKVSAKMFAVISKMSLISATRVHCSPRSAGTPLPAWRHSWGKEVASVLLGWPREMKWWVGCQICTAVV